MAKTTVVNNLALWDSVSTTDPKHTRPVKLGGRTFTTVQAQYQIKMATEKFGSFGFGFGVRNRELREVNLGNGHWMAIYTATLFYHHPDAGECELPIESSISITSFNRSGEFKVDDEYVKKVATDALTKGLSKLGFNADVFLGMFDDNRYVEHLIQQQSQQTAAPATPVKTASKAFEQALSMINNSKNGFELQQASDFVGANFNLMSPTEAATLEKAYVKRLDEVNVPQAGIGEIDLTQAPFRCTT